MFRLRHTRLIKQGWVVGGHETEEVENRFLASRGGAILVSVDYRMAPEYKYPTAVHDCFDALLWVSSGADIHTLCI